MQNPVAHPAPIGVYDSGVGGLAVLRALRKRLPGESFIYVADSANAPYGDRTPEFVECRAKEVTRFLVQRHAKAVVLACNTASVVAAQRLRTLHDVPIIAMEPAIKPATLLTKSRVVLVLATTNTIRSESVARLCRTYGTDTRIILQPCPGLADRVERGEFQHIETRLLLETYIRPGLVAGADTIVLGCTHYAFLADEIAAVAGPSVIVLEPSDAIARQLSRVLPATQEPHHRAATTSFFSSGSTPHMRAFLASIGEASQQVQVLPAMGNPSDEARPCGKPPAS
ncbi:MAG: glutamate racemase [Pseudomonadota bacterium]|nr:glutamate racemase [Pseudomonadota bacterium]